VEKPQLQKSKKAQEDDDVLSEEEEDSHTKQKEKEKRKPMFLLEILKTLLKLIWKGLVSGSISNQNQINLQAYQIWIPAKSK